jgi:hypothetical protein
MGFCFLWFCLKRSGPQNNLYAMRYALCALRYLEATMPAIAPIEDLRAAQKPLRYALCFTEMAQDRLEKCLQAVVTGAHPRTIKR